MWLPCYCDLRYLTESRSRLCGEKVHSQEFCVQNWPYLLSRVTQYPMPIYLTILNLCSFLWIIRSLIYDDKWAHNLKKFGEDGLLISIFINNLIEVLSTLLTFSGHITSLTFWSHLRWRCLDFLGMRTQNAGLDNRIPLASKLAFPIIASFFVYFSSEKSGW